MAAGETVTVVIEMDFTVANIAKDWSVSAWAEFDDVTITHNNPDW